MAAEETHQEQMADSRAEGVRPPQAGETERIEITRHLGVTEAAASKWETLLVEGDPPRRTFSRPDILLGLVPGS